MGGGHFCYLPSYIESMASDGIEQITGSENFIDGLGFLCSTLLSCRLLRCLI